MVVIAIILIGYLFWNVNYSLLFIKKRKDKNFAIRRYKDYFIFYRVDENKVYIDRILNSKMDYVKEFIKEI